MKKVKATAKGHYLKVRQVGESFEVPDEMDGTWFEEIDVDKPAAKGRKPAAKSADADEAKAEPEATE